MNKKRINGIFHSINQSRERERERVKIYTHTYLKSLPVSKTYLSTKNIQNKHQNMATLFNHFEVYQFPYNNA